MAGSSRKRNPSSTLLARAGCEAFRKYKPLSRAPGPARRDDQQSLSNRSGEIGRAASGHVYRASQIALGHRAVALKLIVPQCLEERGSGEGAGILSEAVRKGGSGDLASSPPKHRNGLRLRHLGQAADWTAAIPGHGTARGPLSEQRLRDGPVSPKKASSFCDRSCKDFSMRMVAASSTWI